MAERHRALPSWMARKGETVKEKEPLKSRRKRKTARAAFYLMNEKELLEAAVLFVTEAAREDVVHRTDREVEVKAVDTTVKKQETSAPSKTMTKPVTEVSDDSTDCNDGQDLTYVSETDLDITEVETLPYTRSPQHQGPEGQESGPGQDHRGLMKVEKKEERSQLPADAAKEEEDDAFRLVRDIFFT